MRTGVDLLFKERARLAVRLIVVCFDFRFTEFSHFNYNRENVGLNLNVAGPYLLAQHYQF